MQCNAMQCMHACMYVYVYMNIYMCVCMHIERLEETATAVCHFSKSQSHNPNYIELPILEGSRFRLSKTLQIQPLMTSPRHGQGLMSSLNASLVPGAQHQLERVMVRSISCSEIVESWRHPVLSPAAHRKYRNLDFRIFEIDVHIRWVGQHLFPTQ